MALSPEFVFTQNLNVVTSIHFFSNKTGDFLVTGDDKGNVKLWDLVTYKRLLLMKCHKGKVETILSVGDTLITQSKEEMKTWDFKPSPISFRMSRSFQAQKATLSGCCAIRLESGPMLLASCCPSRSHKVHVHQFGVGVAPTFSLKSKNCGKTGLPTCIKFASYTPKKGFAVITGYESGMVKCYQLVLNEQEKVMGQRECCLLTVFTEPVTSLDYEESGKKGVIGSVGSKLATFRLSPTKEGESFALDILNIIDIGNRGISHVRIRPDSRILCVSCYDKKVKLFSWKTLRLLAVLDHHKESITSIAFSQKTVNREKMFLAVASKDKTISLWAPYNEI